MKVDFKEKAAEHQRVHAVPLRAPTSICATNTPDTLSPANAAVQRMEQDVSVTDWECERDERIAKVQGNHNRMCNALARRERANLH